MVTLYFWQLLIFYVETTWKYWLYKNFHLHSFYLRLWETVGAIFFLYAPSLASPKTWSCTSFHPMKGNNFLSIFNFFSPSKTSPSQHSLIPRSSLRYLCGQVRCPIFKSPLHPRVIQMSPFLCRSGYLYYISRDVLSTDVRVFCDIVFSIFLYPEYIHSRF